MQRFRIAHEPDGELDALVLADDEAQLTAAFLPQAGMVGSSLRHRGEELLGRLDNRERWLREGSTMGIPLLHPWANRVAAATFRVGDVDVEIDPASPLVHADGNGLLIHGVAAPRLPWRVERHAATADAAELAASFAFTSNELLAVFPFPHQLRQTVRLDADGLTVTTELAANDERPVPAAFGYHPYLRLPGVGRDLLHVELPALRRLVLDERSLPCGTEVDEPALAGPLPRSFDDGYAGALDGTRFALAGGGRRLTLTFLCGYPYAQVYAPEGQDYVSFEPMTAPANALVSGQGLRHVPPGETFTAAFRISVEG